ncbi:guanine nucleotide exchange factor for Rab-3A-like [Tubulanus polymorphus]|uniref:guanine nucleotide exchange factor for Rab-3A-like n=1 Tax=Tubulanus polymorphus TaxID=672921 RepID=UPI003DA5A80D
MDMAELKPSDSFQEIDLATPDSEKSSSVLASTAPKTLTSTADAVEGVTGGAEIAGINQCSYDLDEFRQALQKQIHDNNVDKNVCYPSEDTVRRRIHVRSQSDKNPTSISQNSVTLVNGGAEDGFEVRRRSGSLLEIREQTYTRLKEELIKAQNALQLKDAECEKLSQVQVQMEKELEDLTASLFEEANRMVQDANVKRMHQEKLLAEANAKIEVLDAEVTALKALVITSTPSMPNRHLHPQIDSVKKDKASFMKGHRRSTSHHDIKSMAVDVIDIDINNPKTVADKPNVRGETDPLYLQEFLNWKCAPTLDHKHVFLHRILQEDVLPCISFVNKDLSSGVLETVKNNTLSIELIPGKNTFPRKCSLMETNRSCQHRIRLCDTGPWHFICQLARNRIAAVCNFYTYIRYIQQGLVKSEDNEIYWEIIRLRKEIALARLSVL